MLLLHLSRPQHWQGFVLAHISPPHFVGIRNWIYWITSLVYTVVYYGSFITRESYCFWARKFASEASVHIIQGGKFLNIKPVRSTLTNFVKNIMPLRFALLFRVVSSQQPIVIVIPWPGLRCVVFVCPVGLTVQAYVRCHSLPVLCLSVVCCM